MKSLRHSFNIYFALICVAVVANGCAVFHGKKKQSTIRLYLEGAHADRATVGTVLVTSNKFPYSIAREPFLTEADLSKASIVNDPGGGDSYSIKLVFNDHGALLLDMYTGEHKGKHIIIYSQFPSKNHKPKSAKKKSDDSEDSDLVEMSNANVTPPPDASGKPGAPREAGWLAAVLIRNHLTDGTFVFTPDASRKEGFRIVRGLRNVVTSDNKSEK